MKLAGNSSIQQLNAAIFDSKVDIHSSYPRLSIGKVSVPELPGMEGTQGTSYKPAATF